MDDVIKNLYKLFDAAWEENMNGRETDITRMVTTFVPDAIQNLQAHNEVLTRCEYCVLKHYSGYNLWCDIFDKIMPEDSFCCFGDDGK